MQVAVIGGTGFVGSYVVESLHSAGHAVSLLVRPGSEGKVPGDGDRRIVSGDLGDDSAIGEVLRGSGAVIYLVGILRADPARGVTFKDSQFEGVVRVARAATAQGIRRFLLMSANGVEAEATPYQRTKRNAERHVIEGGFDVTVFRPSVIFGAPRGRMEFATQLYEDLVRPPLPAVAFYSGWIPPGNPVMMSPVHARDVAGAFVAALADPATIGQTYCLGGPEALSFAEMLGRIAASAGKRKLIMPMPIPLMRVAATIFDRFSFFPVTRDQLTMLEQNNVCEADELSGLIGRAATAFSPANLAYLTARD